MILECIVSFCNQPRVKGRRLCVGHVNQRARKQDPSFVGQQLVELYRHFASIGYEIRQVPTYPSYYARSDGRIIGSRGLLLEEFLDCNGYARVTTYVKGSRRKWKQVGAHQMVCEAFHGSKPSPEHHAAHWNGIRNDNRPENLRWATAVENERDKTRHGTAGIGERNPSSRLTEEEVLKIRALRSSGLKLSEIGDRFGVTETMVSRIYLRKSWDHL